MAQASLGLREALHARCPTHGVPSPSFADSEGDFDPRSRRKVKKSSKKKHGDHDHDHCPDCGGCSHHGQDEGPSGSGTRQGDAAPAPVAETVLAPSGASGPAGGSPSAGGEGSTKPGGPNPGDASGRGN